MTLEPQIICLEGRPASPGVAVGPVKFAFDYNLRYWHSLVETIEHGDILVTDMTTPEIVPAMDRLGGIVTAEGGMLCHAALLAREFGVPTIVGVGRELHNPALRNIGNLSAQAVRVSIVTGSLPISVKQAPYKCVAVVNGDTGEVRFEITVLDEGENLDEGEKTVVTIHHDASFEEAFEEEHGDTEW